MATPAFEYTTPAPLAGFFVDGEKALGVAATPTSSGRAAYYFARWFSLEAGIYELKIAAQQSVTMWSATEGDAQRLLLSVLPNEGPITVQVFLPAGRQRINLILQHLDAGSSATYVEFSLFRGERLVYGTSAAGWVFATTPVPDADVPDGIDPRRRMPVFSILPNWANGITERLTWRTDVMTSEGDVEQRRPVRRYARRSFEAGFMRHGQRRGLLDRIMAGATVRQILMPMWHEQVYTKAPIGTATASFTVPAGTLATREFRPGDLVFINNKDPQEFDLVEVATVALDTDVITFVDRPTRTWPAGTRLIPLRVARILEAPQMGMPTETVGVVQIRFELEEPEDFWQEGWGYCAPLWRFKIDRGQDITYTFDRETFRLDSDSGKLMALDIADRLRVGMRFAVKIFGRERMAVMRAFLNAAKGRAVRFYMPAQTQEIQLLADTDGGMYLDAIGSGLWDYLQTRQDARLVMSVEFNDGRPTIYRNVSGVQPLTPGDEAQRSERIFFQNVMPPFPKSVVKRISFVMPVRFDQDAVELQHYVDESRAIGMSLVVRSTELEGLPPIECFVTSKPYPIESVDGLSLGFELIGGEVVIAKWPPEALDLTFSFGPSELRTLLVTQPIAPEGLDLDFALLDGEIRTVLLQYTIPSDALDLDFNLLNGEIRTALVSHTYSPEALDIGFALLEGTLE